MEGEGRGALTVICSSSSERTGGLRHECASERDVYCLPIALLSQFCVCGGGGGGGRLAKMRKLNIEMRKCRSKVNGYTFRGSNFFYFPVGLPSH